MKKVIKKIKNESRILRKHSKQIAAINLIIIEKSLIKKAT